MNDRSKLNIEECWYDKRLPAVYMSKQRQWPKILSQPNGQILLSYVNNNIKSTDLNAIDFVDGKTQLINTEEQYLHEEIGMSVPTRKWLI